MGAGNRALGKRNGRNQFDISEDDMSELRKQVMDKNRSAVYLEGQEAARQGLTDADCPYPIGSDDAMDWQDGLASDQ